LKGEGEGEGGGAGHFIDKEDDMAVVAIGNYYAEWEPVGVGSREKCGVGKIVLRSATHLSELYWLTNLGPDDFRILLTLLQTEKPIYWDTEVGHLRTAHPQTADAEPVGEQEGR
jgi:hypothetical protein